MESLSIKDGRLVLPDQPVVLIMPFLDFVSALEKRKKTKSSRGSQPKTRLSQDFIRAGAGAVDRRNHDFNNHTHTEREVAENGDFGQVESSMGQHLNPSPPRPFPVVKTIAAELRIAGEK
jgi:hypothetical protein